MNKLIQVVAILLVTGATLLALGGCSVNVVVAPGATLAGESDLGQSAYQFVEGDGFSDLPGYDCVGAPDADVCQ